MSTVVEKRWQRVAWSILVAWYCIPEDITEAEQEAFLRQLSKDVMTPAVIPTCFVRDRLFGGFNCTQAGRVHVAFLTGCYTYCNPELNGPMDERDRSEKWAELIGENTGENAWRGKVGPFTQDAPEQASRGARAKEGEVE